MKQLFKISHFNFEITNFRARLIILILCFGVFGNTIVNDYNVDDPNIITNNDYVKQGIAGIPAIIANPYHTVYGQKSDYRPLAEITLAIEYQFFGLNPHVSHFVNILLYVFLCWLLYQVLLCFKLSEPYAYLPLLISCFYIVHTAHVEVVASIKNREEIMALFFALAAVLFAYRYYTGNQRKFLNLLAVIICLLLSFLCKTSAAPIIGVIVLMAYQFGPRMPWRKTSWIIPVAVALTGIIHALGVPNFISTLVLLSSFVYVYRDIKDVKYNALMVYVLSLFIEGFLAFQDTFGSRLPTIYENPLSDNSHLGRSVAMALDSAWFYLKFMLFPYPSRYYYGTGSITLHEFPDPVLIFIFLLNALIVGYAFYALWKRQLIGFIIISYFICIYHYLNFSSKYMGIVSERALFLPSIWFITAAFIILFDLFKRTDKKKVITSVPVYAWCIVAALFFLYSMLTIKRNTQWKDHIYLYSADIDGLQNSVQPNLMYGDILRVTGLNENNDALRAQYFDKARTSYQRVIKLAPDNGAPYFGLGQIYRYGWGMVDSGCMYFQQAYSRDSIFSPTKFQVARCLMEEGNNPKALRLLSSLYAELPQDTFVLFYYARSLYLAGDSNNARQVNAVLHDKKLGDSYYYVNEGYFYGLAGNMPASSANYEKALALGYRDPEIFNTLLNYYLNTNQVDKANNLQKSQFNK